jgi:hypothetical protein
MRFNTNLTFFEREIINQMLNLLKVQNKLNPLSVKDLLDLHKLGSKKEMYLNGYLPKRDTTKWELLTNNMWNYYVQAYYSNFSTLVLYNSVEEVQLFNEILINIHKEIIDTIFQPISTFEHKGLPKNILTLVLSRTIFDGLQEIGGEFLKTLCIMDNASNLDTNLLKCYINIQELIISFNTVERIQDRAFRNFTQLKIDLS